MTPLILPVANANDAGARLVEWLVLPGEQVKAGQAVASFETTKVALEVEAPADGWLVSDLKPGDYVEVGKSIGAISETRPTASEQFRPISLQITAKARVLMEAHGISETQLPRGLALIRQKDVAALISASVGPLPVEEDPDEVLLSEKYRELKALLDALRKRMKKKFARHVSTGTLLHDRWELAQNWGFGAQSSVYDECLILGDVRIGESCWIGPNTVIDGSGGGVEIGDWTSIGAGAQVYTHHTIDAALTGGAIKPYRAPTRIGRCCFVAPLAMIAPGTVIDDHCFIAAHSYVEGHFPSHSYIAGNPARVIGRIEIKDGRVLKHVTVAPDA